LTSPEAEPVVRVRALPSQRALSHETWALASLAANSPERRSTWEVADEVQLPAFTVHSP
jgi:hypothetical protein